MGKRTIIFTGATSQLTQFFVKFLQDNFANKFNIILSIKNISDIERDYLFDKYKVSFVVREIRETFDLIKEYKPEYFFNFAAISNTQNNLSENYRNCNFLPVVSHLKAIIKYSPHTKYINAGSAEEFYGTGFYAKYKRLTKKYIKEARYKYNIFAIQPTLFNFTSPIQSENFIYPKLIKEFLRIKKELFGFGEIKTKIKLGNINQEKFFCYIEDVVNYIWLLANQEDFLFREFLLDGVIQGEKITILQLCKKICNEIGISFSEDYIEIDKNLLRKEIKYNIEHKKTFDINFINNIEIIKKMLTFSENKIYM